MLNTFGMLPSARDYASYCFLSTPTSQLVGTNVTSMFYRSFRRLTIMSGSIYQSFIALIFYVKKSQGN